MPVIAPGLIRTHLSPTGRYGRTSPSQEARGPLGDRDPVADDCGAVPASSRGPVTLPVPEPSALIAMEDRVHADPRRADKRATDLLRSDQRRSSRSCGLASPNNR
jgi:hypothetical protein